MMYVQEHRPPHHGLYAAQESAISISEAELENLHAVLGEASHAENLDEASSLAWLALPVEAFCGLLLRLVPEDQAYRRTCAALKVLCLRLEALAGPATRTLVETTVQTGKDIQLVMHMTVASD